MDVLFIPGSLRKDSINIKLLKIAADYLKQSPHNIIKTADLAFPLYDGDIEAKGIPEIVHKLGMQIGHAQAIIIASPEYNYGISGVLKNTIDWVSRIRPLPLKQKPILLMAASAGAIAGIRGLWHTRIPLEGLGNYVYPDMFSLGNALDALNGEKFKDDKNTERLYKTLDNFINFAQKFN